MGFLGERCLHRLGQITNCFDMTNKEEVKNPALCSHCGLIFNFGEARVTYEAIHTGKEVAANCPSCGGQVLYSEAFALLLAESSSEVLAQLARDMHDRGGRRDQFETAVLTEFYKELGRRYALVLAPEDASGTREVRSLPS